MGASFFLFFFPLFHDGLNFLLPCWGPCYVERRSTRARRRTKGKRIFSHGRTMTRLCSCTARLLSTLLLGIPHMVRVRVLLLDHNGPFSFSPFPPSTRSLRSPIIFKSLPRLPPVVRSRFILRAIQWPKAVLTTIDDFVTTFHDT
jgi:hypothetical protein